MLILKAFWHNNKLLFQVLPMKTIAPFPAFSISQLKLPSFKIFPRRARFLLKVYLEFRCQIKYHTRWTWTAAAGATAALPFVALRADDKNISSCLFWGAGYGELTTVIPCQMARLDIFLLGSIAIKSHQMCNWRREHPEQVLIRRTYRMMMPPSQP